MQDWNMATNVDVVVRSKHLVQARHNVHIHVLATLPPFVEATSFYLSILIRPILNSTRLQPTKVTYHLGAIPKWMVEH